MKFTGSTRAQILGCVAVAAIALIPAVATAQVGTSGSLRSQTQTADIPSRVIAINPFLPLFGYFQAEFEQRVKPNVAVALSGSYVKFNDYYTNVDVKLRLYPQERALQGLGIAGGLGFGGVRRSGEICDDFGLSCHRDNRTESAPTFSVDLHYQWLLGSSKATAVTLGTGVKRYFISGARSEGINRVLPTGRLTIGYAF